MEYCFESSKNIFWEIHPEFFHSWYFNDIKGFVINIMLNIFKICFENEMSYAFLFILYALNPLLGEYADQHINLNHYFLIIKY